MNNVGFSLQQNNQTIIGINTVFLYILAALLLGLLIYLYIRNRIKVHKLRETGTTSTFDKMDRSERQNNLKALLQRFPNLESSFSWLDEQLMCHSRARVIEICLEQDWCDCDAHGTQKVPCYFRPTKMVFEADGEKDFFLVGDYKEKQHLTLEESKILGWALMERSRILIPYRRYRMRVHRVTRVFRVENDVPVNWKTDTVIMESYSVEIL